MKNRNLKSQQADSRLKALTAAALKSDKGAITAKEQARLAKAKFKAAKKQVKDAKVAFKEARKLARKSFKHAKRARKALQAQLNRITKRKRMQARPASNLRPRMETATPKPVEVKPERSTPSGNSA